MKICIYILLILVLTPTCLGQSAKQDQPFRSGEYWLRSSDETKYHFVFGYIMGAYAGLSKALCKGKMCSQRDAETFSEDYDRVESIVIPGPDADVLSKVMTDIYKDPANVFISWSDLLVIAGHKLKGQDINEELMNHRKWAQPKTGK